MTAVTSGPFDERAADAAEAAVLAALAGSPVPYEVIACDPALADTAAFCEAYGYEPQDSANTIVVAGRSDPMRFVACVVLAHCRLDVNGAVRRRLGVRKASFASPDQTMELTGMAIGGVTAVGLPAGVGTWVDARVMERPQIVLGGGSRRCKIVAPPALLTTLSGVEIVADLATAITR